MRRCLWLAPLLLLAAGCASEKADVGVMESASPRESATVSEQALPRETAVVQEQATRQEELVIAESLDKTVTVVADPNTPDDLFHGLTVRIGGQERHFPWENVTNPTYYPQVARENVDSDPDDEAVLILTTGYGTGVVQSEVHVLDPDFTEWSAPDPVAAIKARILTSHGAKDGLQRYSLTVNDTTYQFAYADSDAGIWFDDVVLGNITEYSVRDGHLVAEVSVQASPGTFMGTIEAKYAAGADHSLVVESVTFSETV